MSQELSIETGKVREFHTADYVVFAILLAINAGIGLFYAIKDHRQKKENSSEYLLGGRSMNVIPVALSLTVTFLSANTLLGTPVEMYRFSTMFIYLGLGVILATLISAIVFIPFFYRLRIVSTFQYIEMRFSYPVRLLGSVLLVIQTLIYMSFVLYAPSLALSAVTGLSFSGSVVGIGIVVTFYTTLGGMKAVIWTDTFQSLVILAGLLAIFIKGCIEVGGFTAAWEKADERSRVVMDDFSFDPSTRHSFWSVVIGGGFFWMSLYGVNQAQVQRCCSTSSVKKARLAIAISTPTLVFLGVFCCLIGIVMFAFYADCDPVSFGVIEKMDQLLPLFVMDVLGHLHGIPGVFVACIFSGSLSTISSGLNAISAVVYKDFLETCCCKNAGDTAMNIINKVLAVIFGGIMIGLVFLVAELGTLQETSMTVYGILNGPIFGLFVLGMFFPWANSWGALVGCLTSVAFMGWIGIGAYVNEIRSTAPSQTYSTVDCNWDVTTTTHMTTMMTINVLTNTTMMTSSIMANATMMTSSIMTNATMMTSSVMTNATIMAPSVMANATMMTSSVMTNPTMMTSSIMTNATTMASSAMANATTMTSSVMANATTMTSSVMTNATMMTPSYLTNPTMMTPSNMTNATMMTTSAMNNVTQKSGTHYEGVDRLYTLSYLYYTVVGMTVEVVVGLIVSFITGYTRPSEIDPRLICPLFDTLFPFLPSAILKPLRCGVDHTDNLA